MKPLSHHTGIVACLLLVSLLGLACTCTAKTLDKAVDVERSNIEKLALDSLSGNIDSSAHPALNILPNTLLPDSAITPQIIKSLAACHKAWMRHYSIERNFEGVENQVVEKFRRQCLNKTQDKIVDMAGEPFYKNTLIPCWKDTQNYSSTWLYSFGPLKRSVSLSFKDNKCVAADLQDAMQMTIFAHWLSGHLAATAPGQTIIEIQNKLGSSNLSYTKKDETLGANDIKNADRIQYEPYANSAVVFDLQNGICGKVETYWIVH